MKATTLLTIVGSMACIGCTVYPKNYTYSPTVTVNGSEGNTEVTLPNPFAKNHRAESRTKTERPIISTYYEPTANHLPPYIPTPYIQTHGTYYYEADPDSESSYTRSSHQTHATIDQEELSRYVVENTRDQSRDIDQELGDFIIP
jgi:hypothetical protein